jgi:hypothetical protein
VREREEERGEEMRRGGDLEFFFFLKMVRGKGEDG